MYLFIALMLSVLQNLRLLPLFHELQSPSSKVRWPSNKSSSFVITREQFYGNSHFGNNEADVIVWTYPGMPKTLYEGAFEVPPRAKFLCAYESICRQLTEGRRNHTALNLPDFTKGTPYEHFVRHHMYYKVMHGTSYVHHVQSVVICSQYHTTKTLQYLRTLCESYDPTRPDSQVPFQLDFVLEDTAFAAFSYDHRVSIANDANSGDEIQSMAGIQFLPFITRFVDRDTEFPTVTSSTHLIANAWYGVSPEEEELSGVGHSFPPPAAENITFLSMHLSLGGKKMVTNHLEFWKNYTTTVAPVGARDTATLEFLQEQRVPSYLSLCFTLMYQIPIAPTRESILVVDVNDTLLPKDILEKAELLECNVPPPRNAHSALRFRYAFELLQMYANRGKVVITSRIHVALPCLAIGIPVIFVDSETLPGGERGANRTVGISNLFHVYRPHVDKWHFDLDRIGPNPGVHRADRYRASFWNRLKRQSFFYSETARLYGMVPLTRLGKGVPRARNSEPVHDLFHFIFSKDASTLDWKFIRAIEYVFYHHPNARVVIHSNKLPVTGSRLDIFKETGFELVVERYDLNLLLKEYLSDFESVNNFVSNVDKNITERYRSKNLVKFLILWKQGGVYLDTVMYIVRPFPKKMTNALAFWDIKQEFVRSDIMIFEAKYIFLKKALDEILRDYNNSGDLSESTNERSSKDSFPLANLYKDPAYSKTIQILPPIGCQENERGSSESCFSKPRSEFQCHDLNESLAFRLNTSLTTTLAGSLCDSILHKYCIFCDEIHTKFDAADNTL
jgi:hypothetical protein